MRYHTEFRNRGSKDTPERETEIRKLIDNQVSRIEKKLKGLPLESCFLRLVLDAGSRHKQYHASLTLDVPGKVLVAKEEGPKLEPLIREAFTEIRKQLETWIAFRRREHLWKRLGKGKDSREDKLPAGVANHDEGAAFFSLVAPHLEALTDYVRHCLSEAVLRGDVTGGAFSVEDVVDAALISAHDQLAAMPSPQDLEGLLRRLADHHLHAEVRRSRAERRRNVHIEDDVSGSAPATDVSTLGEEVLEFYQPDEDLRLEDIVPDLGFPTPEQEAEKNELRTRVRAALHTMPSEHQRILLLRYVEGLTGQELMSATGLDGAEVDARLSYAREELRQRLRQAGCNFQQQFR